MSQFPAHRFVYVFLRATFTPDLTPGYDVYPEHHFLPAFPWASFGGLFITDEGRFARSPPRLPLQLRALSRSLFRGSAPIGYPMMGMDMGAVRPEESGALPVRLLDEAEMRDVLFWQGCGMVGCTFGCGKERRGEAEAARRLFRPEEVVV